MVTPLGPGDGLQPDVVLGGASQLNHAVGGRRRAQHHLLGQPQRTKTKLTIQHTLEISACVCVGGSSHPDHAVGGGEGQGVAGDGGLRRFPRESGAVGLYVDGLQIPRRVHICKCSIKL